jgi:hypothetical protein
MKKRCVVIDPILGECTEAQYDGYEGLKSLMMGRPFCTVLFTPTDGTKDPWVLFCDDEGLLVPGQSFFVIRNYEQPLGGRAVLCGPIDDEGDNRSLTASVDEISLAVRFLSPDEARRWFTSQGRRPLITVTAIDDDGNLTSQPGSDLTYGDVAQNC